MKCKAAVSEIVAVSKDRCHRHPCVEFAAALETGEILS